MSTLVQDLRFGARLLAKTPGFTVLAILTLALGVTATTTIFSWMNATMLDPVPGVSKTSDLVSVRRSENRMSPGPPVSYLDFIDLRSDRSSLSDMLAYRDDPVFYTGGRVPERGFAAVVSANYFDFLGVRPTLGRGFVAVEDQVPDGAPVAVISADLWQARFAGTARVVGRTIEVNRGAYTIVGVAPPGFMGCRTGVRVDIWIPISMARTVFGSTRLSRRDVAWVNVVGRLQPGVERRTAEAALNVRMRALVDRYPDAHTGTTALTLDPLWRSPFGANGYLAASLPILMAIGGVVLLLACVNVASLLLVRSVTRRHEMAVRLSIGATRGRLVQQLVVESMMLGVAGGIVSAVLTSWTAESLAGFIPPSNIPIALNGRLDARVLAVTLAVSILTCAMCGVWPALRASGAAPVEALKEEAGSVSGSVHKGRVLTSLVVAQVALSAVLLVCAGLFVRSLRNAERADPGFDPRGVVLASVDLQAPGYTREQAHEVELGLLRTLRSLPGVSAVTLADWVPLTSFTRHTEAVAPEGYTPRLHESMDVRSAYVGPEYLAAMHVARVDGRDFTDHDVDGDVRVCIVDRVFADRYWPGGQAVGRRLQARENWHTVVGVAGETRHQRLNEASEPIVYFPLLQSFRSDVTLHVRASGDPQRLVPAVEKAVHALDPTLPVFNVTTLERSIRLGTMFERIAGTFVGVLGLLALALAAVGMYGVLAYSTRQRTREMGIRLALGAGPAQVFGLVLGQGLTLAAAGLALGLLAAAATTRLVRSQLVSVGETDGLTFSAVTVLLAAVAIASCAVPAWRAAQVRPLQALRHE